MSVEHHARACVHDSVPVIARLPTDPDFSVFVLFFFTEALFLFFSSPFVLFNPQPPVPLLLRFLAPAVLVPPPLRRRRNCIAIFYWFYSREHLALGQRELALRKSSGTEGGSSVFVSLVGSIYLYLVT